ncbi:MAG: hypothetical protein ACP5M9_04375 [Candidatus Micrarchaeia archaeon]
MELEEFEKKFKEMHDYWKTAEYKWVHVYISKTTYFVTDYYSIERLGKSVRVWLFWKNMLIGVVSLKLIKDLD